MGSSAALVGLVPGITFAAVIYGVIVRAVGKSNVGLTVKTLGGAMVAGA